MGTNPDNTNMVQNMINIIETEIKQLPIKNQYQIKLLSDVIDFVQPMKFFNLEEAKLWSEKISRYSCDICYHIPPYNPQKCTTKNCKSVICKKCVNKIQGNYEHKCPVCQKNRISETDTELQLEIEGLFKMECQQMEGEQIENVREKENCCCVRRCQCLGESCQAICETDLCKASGCCCAYMVSTGALTATGIWLPQLLLLTSMPCPNIATGLSSICGTAGCVLPTGCWYQKYC